MAKRKVTGRQSEERASTGSRIYVDTLTKLKLLADLENLSLADMLDKVVSAEFTRRRKELHQAIDQLAGDECP